MNNKKKQHSQGHVNGKYTCNVASTKERKVSHYAHISQYDKTEIRKLIPKIRKSKTIIKSI